MCHSSCYLNAPHFSCAEHPPFACLVCLQAPDFWFMHLPVAIGLLTSSLEPKWSQIFRSPDQQEQVAQYFELQVYWYISIPPHSFSLCCHYSTQKSQFRRFGRKSENSPFCTKEWCRKCATQPTDGIGWTFPFVCNSIISRSMYQKRDSYVSYFSRAFRSVSAICLRKLAGDKTSTASANCTAQWSMEDSLA